MVVSTVRWRSRDTSGPNGIPIHPFYIAAHPTLRGHIGVGEYPSNSRVKAMNIPWTKRWHVTEIFQGDRRLFVPASTYIPDVATAWLNEKKRVAAVVKSRKTEYEIQCMTGSEMNRQFTLQCKLFILKEYFLPALIFLWQTRHTMCNLTNWQSCSHSAAIRETWASG